MGLDMYLNKTKRVENLSVEDYSTINEALPWNTEEYDFKKGLTAICKVKDAFKLNDEVKERGSHFTYLSIFKDAGYWRKANAIHKWFVDNCQDGVDECQLSEVTEGKLQELLDACKSVKVDNKLAGDLLPPQSGFFFGSTEIDEWYMQDIDQTIDILSELLDTTDFEKEIVFYQSSW